jgi:hypothetical protein
MIIEVRIYSLTNHSTSVAMCCHCIQRFAVFYSRVLVRLTELCVVAQNIHNLSSRTRMKEQNAEIRIRISNRENLPRHENKCVL